MNETIGVPPGFRDVLFVEARKQRTIETALDRVFAHGGFQEIIPSSIEFFDAYVRGDRGIEDRVYRFLNRDDVLLALRADFTLSIARIAATRLEDTPRPYRIWYSGSVFRKVDPTRGQYKETRQIGAELLGTNSAASNAELIGLAVHCLEALGIRDVQLHLNHAGVFRGIVDSLGLGPDALQQVKTEIDRKDMRMLASRLSELSVSSNVVSQLELLSRSIGNEEVLAKAEQFLSVPASLRAIAELRSLSEGLGTWKNNITFDLTEIDDMEYYTGIFFSFFSPQLRRELGRGGRYDNMLENFGSPMPAVGFSFSLDELVRLV